jgi:hypothetical protein
MIFSDSASIQECAGEILSWGFLAFFSLMGGLILVILAAMIVIGFKLLIGKD